VEAVLLPPLCLLCNAPGTAGRDLCAGCATDLPGPEPACPVCGDTVPVALICGQCRRRPPPFVSTTAALRYAEPADRLVIDLKFRDRLPAARLLGALLGDVVADVEPPEVLLPVPLHPARLRERGFNQALELARPLARRFDRPLLIDAVRRIRATPPQTGTDRGARRRNIRNAFALHRPLPWRHVAIVDDVMTTGSTVAELARLLRRNGVERVQVWVAARAQRDR
jgi:ComF family protein